MNETANSSILGIMIFSGLVVAVLYCIEQFLSRARRTEQDLWRIDDHDFREMGRICQENHDSFGKVLAMPLPAEERALVQSQFQICHDAMASFKKNDRYQYLKVMDILRKQRRWISNYQDKLLVSSVKIDSPFYDYNR